MRVVRLFWKMGKKFVVWEARALLPLLVVSLLAGVVVHRQNINDTFFNIRTLIGAATFAYKMDKAYDRLPSIPLKPNNGNYPIVSEDYGGLFSCWGMMTNSETLCKFTLEALPYFYYEGLHGEDGAVIPSLMALVPGLGVTHFHVGGRASCVGAMMTLNYRYMNYTSPWNDADSLLAILIHELGHIQGVCGQPADLMEASNQVLTVEVLAGMANHNNHYAVKPLVKELRDFGLDYIHVQTYGTHWEGVYQALTNKYIFTTFGEQSRRAKSGRYWAEYPDELKYILTAYGAMPYRLIGATRQRPDQRTDELQLVYWGQTLVLDDLVYFLEHLDEHVQNAQNGHYD